VPAAAVIRRMRALSGFIGFKGCVGGLNKSVVKSCSLTVALPLILLVLSLVKVGGMCNVAVKCLDITQNTNCEGSLLDRY
jgi:hypothetical protein